jgi:aspartokinase/homoserine dehydrogenase 1
MPRQVDEFLSRLHEFDDEMSSRARAAESAGSALRFVGCVDLGADGGGSGSASCTAGIRLFPVAHPFAQMSGSDNVLEFATSRYSPNPLIVRGQVRVCPRSFDVPRHLPHACLPHSSRVFRQGAGAQVTAAGVFSDLLHIATHSGAPNL